MMWSAIGNKWFDKWIKQFMSFTIELDSLACNSSPLTKSEKDKLRNIMQQLNKVNNDIRNRLNG